MIIIYTFEYIDSMLFTLYEQNQSVMNYTEHIDNIMIENRGCITCQITELLHYLNP